MTTPTNPPAVCPRCESALSYENYLHIRFFECGLSWEPVMCNEPLLSYADVVGSLRCKDRQISLLTAKLAELEAADRWIPVGERLPEAGLPVIAFVQRIGWRRRIRAFYAPPKSIEVSDDNNFGEYDEEGDCYWLSSGWYEDEEVNWHVDDPVTHWRPLPEGPKEDLK